MVAIYENLGFSASKRGIPQSPKVSPEKLSLSSLGFEGGNELFDPNPSRGRPPPTSQSCLAQKSIVVFFLLGPKVYRCLSSCLTKGGCWTCLFTPTCSAIAVIPIVPKKLGPSK